MEQKNTAEYEFKYKLDKDNYEKLIEVCSGDNSLLNSYSMMNYYFDTKRLFFNAHRVRIRLRVIDDTKAVVTVKHPIKKTTQQENSMIKVRGEIEAEISMKNARRIMNEELDLIDFDIEPINYLQDNFEQDKLEKVRCLGEIKTKRSLADISEHARMEIDKSKIFTKSFYEAEVEVKEEQLDRIDKLTKEFFRKHDIEFEPSKKSKASRLMREVSRMRG